MRTDISNEDPCGSLMFVESVQEHGIILHLRPQFMAEHQAKVMFKSKRHNAKGFWSTRVFGIFCTLSTYLAVLFKRLCDSLLEHTGGNVLTLPTVV